MKILFSMVVAAVLCSACAMGGTGSSAGSGSITMYGTIDEGIAVHN